MVDGLQMIQDVYEPLTAYREEFRDNFSRLSREKFKSLTEESGIDVSANRAQVKVVRKLESELSSAQDNRSILGFLMVLGYIAAAICFGVLMLNESIKHDLKPMLVCGGAVGLVFGIWMTVLFSNVGEAIQNLKDKIAKEKKKAWEQMAPLNNLYSWDVTVKLIEATVPRLQFDPYFTAKRLRDLKRVYGWHDDFNDGKSIVFAQSGVINGNPFLFGEYLEMEWGEETYTGSLDIEWEEEEKDSEGNVQIVTRYETLTASVTKPIPRYSRQKILIYGNDAAPNLKFTRQPSGFDEDDLFDGIRKKWRLSRLKAKSRNLDDDSNFTLMSNHEFETWFHAEDRDNEVEFRLLFTALAQMQMMALMKDRQIGFGDDFVFIKDKKLNYLFSRHLADAEIDTAPEHFYNWSYDDAARVFQSFNEKYFRDVYFALAPLLAIPLYQQTRTHEEIWKDVLDNEGASFWEHEAMANCYGDSKFKHPDCITQNILKTRVVGRSNGVSEVEVTAFGYCGEDRVDYEDVYGVDGNWHSVPIEWVEYLPVEKTTSMFVSENEESATGFGYGFMNSADALYRRSIYSYLDR